MRITKLLNNATVFGLRVSTGYKVLSKDTNFYLYFTSPEDGPVECLLTSADHRELPSIFGEAIENCGYSWEASVSGYFTYYIFDGQNYGASCWDGLETEEKERAIGILLDAITTEIVKYETPDYKETDFPLEDILNNSLYYPSSATDIGIIKYCNGNLLDQTGRNLINSFVYADYALGNDEEPGDRYLQARLDIFRGYHVLFTREIRPQDLVPQRKIYMPAGIDLESYRFFENYWRPFARWTVYEMDSYDDFDDFDHGPERFSLLFIGGEGVATYSGLYLSRGITPKALAIIQPGHAFGLNWTNYGNPEAPMADVVRHGSSMPDYIFFGGMGDLGHYRNFQWPGYRSVGEILPYQTDNYTGTVVIYKRIEDENRN